MLSRIDGRKWAGKPRPYIISDDVSLFRIFGDV